MNQKNISIALDNLKKVIDVKEYYNNNRPMFGTFDKISILKRLEEGILKDLSGLKIKAVKDK
jgi:hypothetical protein